MCYDTITCQIIIFLQVKNEYQVYKKGSKKEAIHSRQNTFKAISLHRLTSVLLVFIHIILVRVLSTYLHISFDSIQRMVQAQLARYVAVFLLDHRFDNFPVVINRHYLLMVPYAGL